VLDHTRFEPELSRQIEEARRLGRQLSLVLITVDSSVRPGESRQERFGGALRDIAHALGAVVRHDDVMTWAGGGLFAWTMLCVDEFAGWEAAERLRRDLVRRFADSLPVSFAVGVCELGPARRPEDLLWRACVALSWAQFTASGFAFRYTPDVVNALQQTHGVVAADDTDVDDAVEAS
jgi:PleD family two-component response regulator